MDNAVLPPVLRFDTFRLDRYGGLSQRREHGAWEPIVLGSRALEVLHALVAQRGELVTKRALMDAAWAGMTVEDANLTVQISTLRRVLDEGRSGGSCIQTVIGRGYRFLPAVTLESDPLTEDRAAIRTPTQQPAGNSPSPSDDLTVEIPVGSLASRRRPPLWSVLVALLVLGGVGLGAWLAWPVVGRDKIVQVAAPRLSVVVLPFRNLSGDPRDDYLADGITDDLTSDLSRIPQTFVIANASARAFKAPTIDAKQIGRELAVRYILEGSVRRIGAVARVNAQLISTETGAHAWSDRFDEPIDDLAGGQDAILARIRGELGISLVEIEVARARRAPRTTPDAYDLILKARAVGNEPPNQQRWNEGLSLYEQALRLDPFAVLALRGAVGLLLEAKGWRGTWATDEQRRRAETLLTRLRAVAPASEEYLAANAFWLRTEDASCQQAIVAARQLIEKYPNRALGYALLGWCRTATGHAEDEIPLNETLIRLNPRDPYLYARYRRMGYAAMLLGRDQDAVRWLELALAAHPEASSEFLIAAKLQLAAAYGNAGDETKARAAIDDVQRVWPFDTIRQHWPETGNPVLHAQIRRFQEGLRRAGERDHADEDADFGVFADAELHSEVVGYTPLTAPGATTIRTVDLPGFITERHPLIIDLLAYSWGRSIPGAIGLRYAGVGGTVSDGAQERLRRVMSELTGGELSRPIVTVGWNSERFDGRNLALRLVALGYNNVVWYRGGREAWELAELPEAKLASRDW